jgi:hypothetical protein
MSTLTKISERHLTLFREHREEKTTTDEKDLLSNLFLTIVDTNGSKAGTLDDTEFRAVGIATIYMNQSNIRTGVAIVMDENKTVFKVFEGSQESVFTNLDLKDWFDNIDPINIGIVFELYSDKGLDEKALLKVEDRKLNGQTRQRYIKMVSTKDQQFEVNEVSDELIILEDKTITSVFSQNTLGSAQRFIGWI